MKLIPFIILILLGYNLHADNSDNLITVGAAEFVLPEGWHHEKEMNAGRLTVNVYHPDSPGVLKLSSMKIPSPTTTERLRNLTNVDLSLDLEWQTWGDYSGYQYDYSEKGKSFRQWWLMNEEEILFLVYMSDVRDPADNDVVNGIVASINLVEW
jgi:hypothetical protein